MKKTISWVYIFAGIITIPLAVGLFIDTLVGLDASCDVLGIFCILPAPFGAITADLVLAIIFASPLVLFFYLARVGLSGRYETLSKDLKIAFYIPLMIVFLALATFVWLYSLGVKFW
jgi:hypothetical protein